MADYKALAREMYESMAPGQDVEAMVDRYMAEDFVEHEAIPWIASTRETPRPGFAMLFAAFPDLRIVVHDMLQEDDKVAVRVTFTGTHLGDFMGVSATGNHVEWNAMDILQFRGDQAGAHWGVMYLAGAMAQMGVGPG